VSLIVARCYGVGPTAALLGLGLKLNQLAHRVAGYKDNKGKAGCDYHAPRVRAGTIEGQCTLQSERLSVWYQRQCQTRLLGAHVPLSEVVRVLGHTQANTTYRYVNANIETARRAAAALDAFNADGTLQPEPVEMVN
jgi:hypothetical protein